MNHQLLFLLFAAGAVSHAADRSSFDFGWSFKYFGAGNKAAVASSAESGHPAEHAIDGDENTRWCASSAKPGQTLEVKPGLRDALECITIVWENDRPLSLEARIRSGKKTARKSMEKRGAQTTIRIGGRPVTSLSLTINGTRDGAWASIREIWFTNTRGERLKAASASVTSGVHAERPDFKGKGFKEVQLPHDWAVESPFLAAEPNETGKLPWNGMGWYRKLFEVPATFDAQKDRYYLDFDGVMANPKVYVNGHLAGEWAYGYSAFRVDLTPHLKAGQPNLIAVQAYNEEASTRWYPGAGIYRHTWLEKTGPVHLAQWGVYATTPRISADAATVRVETTVENTSAQATEVTVHQSIGSAKAQPARVSIAPGASEVVVQELTLENPELWSCENPHLYELRTEVHAGNRRIDDKVTTIGVRSIEWKSDGFYLNGKRVQLQGVCEHHDLGPLGAAFHERAFERKIEILKEMGCNAIRTSHNPPAAEVLDLCDRHGVLVIDEVFDIWKYQKYDKVNGYHKHWPKWWKKDVRQFALRDRNHPCVIAWSGGNEIIEIVRPDGPDISSGIREEFRRYDTTRPYTVGVNDWRGAFNGFARSLDVYGYNYKPAHYRKFEESYQPGMPYYGSETGSCVATRDTYFFPLRWGVGDGFRNFQVSAYGLYAPNWAYCPDAEFTAHDQNPNCAGEFVWTGFDYLGEPTPYNQDQSNANNFGEMSPQERDKAMALMKAMGDKAPSRSSYFGIIDLAGFPKDTYYLYQSRWRPEVKQAHILPHWNWKGREGVVTPVMVFSSGDEAELFLNGKSLGVRRKGEGGTFHQLGMTISKNGHRFTWEDVVYEPGELRVVVKKDGQPWATASRVTTGAARKLKAVADRRTIAGDGHDLSYISVATVDARGHVVPTDCRKVSFAVEGPAELVGFCNGDPTDQRCMQDPNQAFFNGRLVAVLRSVRGGEGKAVVTIQPKGLPSVRVPVTVAPVAEKPLR